MENQGYLLLPTRHETPHNMMEFSQRKVSGLSFSKYRFSNNNNSSDASTFHRDLYNHTENDIVPIFTVLVYFDDTQMELIPGSHIKNNKYTFDDRKTIDIKAGNTLVIFANLLHRGKNFTNSGNRRILQIFEVCEPVYRSLILTCITSRSNIMKSITNLSKKISTNNKWLDLITHFHYYLIVNDLQYKIFLMDIPESMKRGRMVGYESSKRSYDTGLKETNVNIILGPTQTVVLNNYKLICVIILLLSILLLRKL